MKSQDIIAILRKHETELRLRGILQAALFGSVARGTARPESDIDIMIDVDPNAVQDMYSYVGLKTHIAELFEGSVDVVDRAALKSPLRTAVEVDAVYAF